jgi:hypothetical protein
LEPFLRGAIVRHAINGLAMITMAIALGGGVFYWLGSYTAAFWLLVYAIIYGGLDLLRGDNGRLIHRDGSGLTIAVLIPVAWHVGQLAGYF